MPDPAFRPLSNPDGCYRVLCMQPHASQHMQFASSGREARKLTDCSNKGIKGKASVRHKRLSYIPHATAQGSRLKVCLREVMAKPKIPVQNGACVACLLDARISELHAQCFQLALHRFEPAQDATLQDL